MFSEIEEERRSFRRAPTISSAREYPYIWAITLLHSAR
jgi:hypothetical protein